MRDIIKAVALLLCLWLPSFGALAVVDANCVTSIIASTTNTVALTVTTGNALWVMTGWQVGGAGCGATTVAISDNAGTPNTYTQVGAINTSAYMCSASFYAKNVTGGSLTITSTVSSSQSNLAIVAIQVSGADTASPLDAGPANAGGVTGTTPVSASYTTAVANEILIAGAWDYYIGDTVAANSGYTIPSNGNCTSVTFGVIAVEDKIVSSTQSGVTSGFAITGMGYTNIGVGTLKQAGGAAVNSLTPAHSSSF